MRHLATLLIIVILVASCSAQTTTNGALRQSTVVVTNEQDLVGIQFAKTNLVMKIHNPANVNEWIDGAGNKYVVSNLFEMTFSQDFASNFPDFAHEDSYTFTSSGQTIHGVAGIHWWDINTGAIEYWPGGGFFTRNWGSTTNEYVLDPVLYQDATGYAYIRPYSTTNLVALATTPSVTTLIESLRDFHVDSATNIVWKTVYSNGWMWLVAYTNYPTY